MKLPDFRKLLGLEKKEETPVMETKPLPEDLEKFRMERPAPEPVPIPSPAEERYGAIPERPEPVGVPAVAVPPAAPEPAPTGDRIDMILQKLETIDTRLKLLEEKMK